MSVISPLFGSWVLLESLGRDSWGESFRAHPRDDPQRIVWLKRIAAAVVTDEAQRERFFREAELLRRLDHPHLQRLLEVGSVADAIYIVSEFPEAPDLETVLRSQSRLPWPEVLDIAAQVVAALRVTHARGILHRDLKPAHLWRTADGAIRLAGFALGLPPASVSASSGNPNSVAYLAPELANGKQPTKRSDFYALGGVLYTLVTGRTPFSGKTPVEIIHKHCTAQVERPSRIVADLPAELDELIRRLLNKDPALRPGDGLSISKELERIRSKLQRQGKAVLPLRATTIGEPAEMKEVPPPGSPDKALLPDASDQQEVASRGRWLQAVGLSLALLVVIALIVYGLSRSGPSATELYTQAEPLLASANPSDWERAWVEYLEPLQQRYPNEYRDEIAHWQQVIDDHREQRRTIAQGWLAHYSSEAERFYYDGLARVKLGQMEQADQIWQALIDAFASVPGQERWVRLAQEGRSRLKQSSGESLRRRSSPGKFQSDAGFQQALVQAREAWQRGEPAVAQRIWAGLEILYANSPDAVAVRQRLEQERLEARSATVPAPGMRKP